MLTEVKFEEVTLQQGIERLAMNEEMTNSLVPIVESAQATFKDLQNKADDLSASQMQISKRLGHLEARHVNVESQKINDETIQAYTVAIEEQERLVQQLEQQLLLEQQFNDELATKIERLKLLKSELTWSFNLYQLQISNESLVSQANDHLTSLIEKVNLCQTEINKLEVERVAINNKIVALRSRQTQHSHSSGYTYGNYSGSAGYSSGPV